MLTMFCMRDSSPFKSCYFREKLGESSSDIVDIILEAGRSWCP